MNPELSYAEARARLEAVGAEAGFGIKPDLSRIRELSDLLDHPERTYPTIHVAGTNGKTSTVRAVAAILAGHGLKTGFYTSPHLQTPRERFALSATDGKIVSTEMISKEQFARVYGYLEPFLSLVEDRLHSRVTYFETTTAIAFEWMSDRACAAGVVETGMGGTWDATNIVEPSVCVITPVDVDHVDRLGPTPLDGAKEKAGIIKTGAPVVIGEQRPDVAAYLAKVADGLGTTMLVRGVDFDVEVQATAIGGRVASIRGAKGRYEDLFVPLFGSHQVDNVAMAVAACEAFLDSELDESGLRAGLAALSVPGRLELVAREPVIVLDGAHNPHGARTVVEAVRESFGDVPTAIVIAVMSDKDIDGIASELSRVGATVIATQISASRSMPATEIASSDGWAAQPTVIAEMSAAIDAAREVVGPDGLVLVTGSLYAVGAARDIVLGPVE